MKVPNQCLKALVWLLCCICPRCELDVFAQSSSSFDVRFTGAGIAGLTKRIDDTHHLQCIAQDKILGHVGIRYRLDSGPWQAVHTSELEAEPPRVMRSSADEHLVSYDFDAGKGLALSEHFVCERDSLQWRMRLINRSRGTLEIGDLVLPLPMNTTYPKHQPEETFTSRLFRHSFISGHGSFVFWLPVGGVGPHLVMTPLAGTQLEYFSEARANYAVGGSGYTAYIHSAALAAEAQGGSWRQESTSLRLAPGEDVTYGFQFDWTDSYQGVRDILYETGGFDVRVAPGMVVPEDLCARVALRTRNTIGSLAPEFPYDTQIDTLGERQADTHLYRLRFSRLGENRVTVHTEDGKVMVLEFFVTQPLETLIKKRAAFITDKQQYRDPSQWYNGLFSLWDMRKPSGQSLLGPDNLGGQHLYAVSGSDDPSSGKPVFLAEKNLAYPDARQIAALEYYLEHFVWGKHQRTDQESPYPYGVYGSEHWHMNRQATRDPIAEGKSRPGKGGGGCRMWRTFDYTHYIQLYTNMYRIAKQHPHLVHYLDAQGYLERAWGTARAYFQVPYNIYMEGGWAFTGWTDWAYKLGNFHEKYLLPLMEALETEGQTNRADQLRAEWEKKVKYFLYDDPYPYTSEMPVDSTAFESSYAIAKYALTHALKPDHRLWQDKNSGQWYSHPRIDTEVHKEFMQRQLLANLACRGWLETSYYHLGSDFRGLGSSGYTLSYMSQMGGWAVLDHALHFAETPADTLRLGYASLLSSWALVNSGNVAGNYGFWFPGKRHDGAVGWGFCPQRVGQEWNRGCWDLDLGGVPRGIWPVCGEIDHGLCAGVEAACTVVVDDPVFGLMAYGGSLETDGDLIRVVCRDGVRQRLHFLQGDTRFHLQLDRDGFARDVPVLFDQNLTRLGFSLESRSQAAHTTRVTLQGLPQGTYTVTVNDRTLGAPITTSGQASVVAIPVPAKRRRMRVLIARDDSAQVTESPVHRRDVLRPFDYGAVTLLPGRLHDQFHQVKDFYQELRDTDILKLFRLRKSRRAPGRELGGAYSDNGLTFGQWLGAYARMYKVTGDTALANKALYLMREWGRTLDDDGSFGYAPDGRPSNHYNYDKMVQGLVDIAEFLGEKEAFTYLDRITAWAEANLDRSNPYALPSEWYTLAENLYRAYQLSGDERYYAFAKVWEYTDYWDIFAKHQSPFQAILKTNPKHESYHAYSHVNALSSAAKAYEVTGEPHYLDTIVNAYDFLKTTQMFATGGLGPEENFVVPDGLPETLVGDARGASNVDVRFHFETACGSWAAFKLGRYLMRFTGQAHYGDWIERILYNGVGAMIPMNEDGMIMYGSCYHLHGAQKSLFTVWFCCSGTLPLDVTDYHRLIYFHDPGALYVNLFLPSRVQWQGPSGPVTLVQETEYPRQGIVRMQVQPEHPGRFAVRFRVPEWATQGVAVTINDQPLAIPTPPGQWATLDRHWDGNDTVTLRFDLTPRGEPLPGTITPVAVLCGPVVMVKTAAREKEDWLANAADLKIPADWLTVHGRVNVDQRRHLHTNQVFRPFYEVTNGEYYRMYFNRWGKKTVASDDLVFHGDWTAQGLRRYTDVPGSAFTATFKGSALIWEGLRHNHAGIARVFIDGKGVAEVDQYAYTDVYVPRLDQREVPFRWSISDIGGGEHTLRVLLTERKNPASQGNSLNVQRLLVYP